jgi:hypothetical protein
MLWSTSLCSFLEPPVISYFFGPLYSSHRNIFQTRVHFLYVPAVFCLNLVTPNFAVERITLLVPKFQCSDPLPDIGSTCLDFLWVFSSLQASSVILLQIMLRSFPSVTSIIHNSWITLSFDIIQN